MYKTCFGDINGEHGYILLDFQYSNRKVTNSI